MIALHTVFVVTLVAQATSALVLALLAWSDRRSRGLPALATACTLHAAAIYLIPIWQGSDHWYPEAVSAALFPLIFYFIHCGLLAFVRPGQHSSREGRFAMAGAIVVVVAIAPWNTLWSMQFARVVALGIMTATVRVLWNPKNTSLRAVARTAGALLILIFASIIVRLPMETHAAPSRLLLSLRELTMIASTLLTFSLLAVYLADRERRHNDETRLDALTGLLNRRAMEERAADLVRVALRTGQPLALLMMDLDAFKLLNDTWGHSAGDRALRAVGDVLRQATEAAGDSVARLGGEEFAVLLPNRSLGTAQEIAEQLRLAITGVAVVEGDRRAPLTISIGVAAWHPGEASWTEMLQRADAALYQAKREGRNRVVLCEEAVRISIERREHQHGTPHPPAGQPAN